MSSIGNELINSNIKSSEELDNNNSVVNNKFANDGTFLELFKQMTQNNNNNNNNNKNNNKDINNINVNTNNDSTNNPNKSLQLTANTIPDVTQSSNSKTTTDKCLAVSDYKFLLNLTFISYFIKIEISFQ
jgi:hypothetical protein